MVSVIDEPRKGKHGTRIYQNDLEQHLQVDLHKQLVPIVDIRRFAAFTVLTASQRGSVAVVLAPLENFSENSLADIRNWNRRMGNHVIAKIANQVLDHTRAASDGAI